MASAWEKMTGQAGGHIGSWKAGPPQHRPWWKWEQDVEVEAREKPRRRQPSKPKSYDELLAEYKARSS